MRNLNFTTLQEAWEKLNEGLAADENFIKGSGGMQGSEITAYNTFVNVERVWVDPDFDFGTTFGYHQKKWTALVKNYVDFNYLDLVKNEIRQRVEKKTQQYAHSFHFSNKHNSGKDCLISLVFLKQVKKEKPIVYFMVRASEITCRLLFDFLLMQRICEYVYGHSNVEAHILFPKMFITAERFCMYHNYKNVRTIIGKPQNKFQEKILDKLKYLETTHPDKIKFKVIKRSAQNLQKDAQGKNLSGVNKLKAKKLKLIK